MSLTLAIDLGGTKIEAALVDERGQIVEGTRSRIPTGPATTDESLVAALDHLVCTLRRHPHWAYADAAGIGTAGPVDLDTGTASPLNMPGLRGFPLGPAVRNLTHLPTIALRLDGTCIALAEAWRGAAYGAANALVMVVSTGVGGGIISNGRVITGASGNAGHIGQLVVRDPSDGLHAATVEGIASGPRSVEWARQQGWKGSTGEELATSVRCADPIALAAVSRSAKAVGIGIANASTLLDLEVAVIGGGFASVSDDYAARVQQSVTEHAVNAYAAKVRVVPALLGGEGPLIGAAALIQQPSMI